MESHSTFRFPPLHPVVIFDAPKCHWPAVIQEIMAVIFGAPNWHLGGLVPPFWHPGGPSWHLGGTMGAMLAAGRTHEGPGLDF